jgi:protease-4
LLVYLPSLEAGWAACESVRDIFHEIRATGKHVVCYLPEGGGNRELYVALSATQIFLAPYAGFGPLGLAARPFYIRPLLDRLGISVEAQSAGEYKSAAEPALRETMSEPAREQQQAILSTVHEAMVAALRERGLSTEQVEQLFASGLLQAQAALSTGVIDGIVFEDELYDRLGCTAPSPALSTEDSEDKPATVEAVHYLRQRTSPLWRPVRREACIAVVPLHGTIVADQGGRWGAPGLRPAAFARLLRRISHDPAVRAAIFYIDSPGGSALASELMHHEIARFARRKPAVAYFGDVAASGGYYLACACRKIVAQSLTVTGSIGVVSAKVDASGLLERLGVRPQFLRTTRSADMFSFARGLSPDEDGMLRAHAAEIYERFLTVVAEGRGRPVADIEPLARGRVWTGRDASERGLVDALGSFDRALDEVRGLMTDIPPPARAHIKPYVYRLKAGSGFDLVDGLRSLLLAPWLDRLPDLAAIELLLGREPVTYYAPLHHMFEQRGL